MNIPRSKDRPPLVLVAHRLPVERAHTHDGSVQWVTSPGEFVAALMPLMGDRDTWLGWDGRADGPAEAFVKDGVSLVPLSMSKHEATELAEGFSNSTMWPLYHDVVAKPSFNREGWDAYVQVNQRFATKAAEVADRDATVWVHDYQLQLVPAMLRALRPDLRIGFYLHIPFPPAELFSQLPWRRQILEGLLGADLVGFQQVDGAQNFVRLVRQRAGHKTHRDSVYLPDGRVVLAKAFPISIDFKKFAELAGSAEVALRASEIRRQLGDPKHVMLGIDALDYTKGIYDRLQAFAELVDSEEIAVEETVFVQVATPSEGRGQAHARLRDDIELLVARINTQHALLGRPAVAYLHAFLPRAETVALYRAADIMIVTPFRDGMNLAAKEYVACRDDHSGALVLSEFAGAADELPSAYMVNPHDINGMKQGIVDALQAKPKDLARRMRAMRKTVADHDVEDWAEGFRNQLEGTMPTHSKQVRRRPPP